MSVHAHISSAERAGLWLGRAWRGFVRQEARAVRWMVDAGGASPFIAKSLLWAVKLTVLAVLLYTAFWVALALVFVLIAAALLRVPPQRSEQPEWLAKDPDDHRDDLFYHPLSYNDDPDPRFHDPRLDDDER